MLQAVDGAILTAVGYRMFVHHDECVNGNMRCTKSGLPGLTFTGAVYVRRVKACVTSCCKSLELVLHRQQCMHA